MRSVAEVRGVVQKLCDLIYRGRLNDEQLNAASGMIAALTWVLGENKTAMFDRLLAGEIPELCESEASKQATRKLRAQMKMMHDIFGDNNPLENN